jgi:amidase
VALHFALGTDTGGSVRVPASNCGIWGIRPTHSAVSVAGVSALAPSFDTVGILADDFKVLVKAASVLLSAAIPLNAQPAKIYLIREAFEICDPLLRSALEPALAKIHERFGYGMEEISMREIDGKDAADGLSNWYEIYRVLQRAEAQNIFGAWIEAEKPQMGSMIQESLMLARTLDRALVPGVKNEMENYFRRMRSFLGKKDLLCFPTVPAPALRKGTVQKRDEAANGYYFRTLCLTSIAGVARLPQISMPVGTVQDLPVGLSLLARDHEDAFLLGVIDSLGARLLKNL